MTDNGKSAERSFKSVRVLGWGVAALILLLPLILNAPWTPFDFVVMGALLGGVGLLLELAVRASGGNVLYRAGAGVAVMSAFLLVWVNGAVGFLGDEDNPANLLFFGVIGIAIIGSVLARLRPTGMARTMLVLAALQVLVGIAAVVFGLGSPGYDGLYEATMGTTVFAGLWLVAAALFRRAAAQPTTN